MSETTKESLENMNLEELRSIAAQEAPRIAELGNWPDWKKGDAVESIAGRIPKAGQLDAPGFDAGLASAFGMIPLEKQKLAASLHGNYTPEAVEQVRREIKGMDPNSETAWWLAASNVCGMFHEGAVDEKNFRTQIREFENLAADPKARATAALKEIKMMTSTFETNTYGVPYGEVDGCLQGAYLDGWPFGIMYSSKYDIYFVGTFYDSLGLENFKWSDQKDASGKPKSGPVFGSRQFIKCADKEELANVLEILKTKFNKELAEKKKII